MGSVQSVELQERAPTSAGRRRGVSSVPSPADAVLLILGVLVHFDFFVWSDREDCSRPVEEWDEGTLSLKSLCLLKPTRKEPFMRIHWTFIYNGTIWYYLILNLML